MQFPEDVVSRTSPIGIIMRAADTIEKQYGYEPLKYCFDPGWEMLARVAFHLDD